MTKYQIFILLISFLYINNFSYDGCFENNTIKENCHKKTDSNSGNFCCHLNYTSKENKKSYALCTKISKDQKDKIKDLIRELISNGAIVKSLDCKSSYLELGLLIIIILLF